MRIFTSRYSNKGLAAWKGAKVGITLYSPRFKVGYKFEWLKMLAPDREMFHIGDEEEFRKLYTAKLDMTGVDTVLHALDQISTKHGGADLALLCFEDVLAGDWCHRQHLALWLKEQAGIEVTELPQLPLGLEHAQPVQSSFL